MLSGFELYPRWVPLNRTYIGQARALCYNVFSSPNISFAKITTYCILSIFVNKTKQKSAMNLRPVLVGFRSQHLSLSENLARIDFC